MAALPLEQYPKQFTYDVAFSFCAEDEGLAKELDDLLGERFKTFLYSRSQEVLAGKDGEEVFPAVFGEQARLVVVLHRPKWGTTPFTRIEETAIKNRAFNSGYDFTVWVALEEKLALPAYIPKSRLYVGHKEYGTRATAAVIEARVQDCGGEPRIESFEEKAARLNRQLNAEKERHAFLATDAALQAARQEYHGLLDEVAARVERLRIEAGWTISIKRPESPGYLPWLDVGAEHVWLSLDWEQTYGNSLDGSGLKVGVWNGIPHRLGRNFYDDPPTRQVTRNYTFDRTVSGVNGWSLGGRFTDAKSMVEAVLDLLIEQAHARGSKGRR